MLFLPLQHQAYLSSESLCRAMPIECSPVCTGEDHGDLSIDWSRFFPGNNSRPESGLPRKLWGVWYSLLALGEGVEVQVSLSGLREGPAHQDCPDPELPNLTHYGRKMATLLCLQTKAGPAWWAACSHLSPS